MGDRRGANRVLVGRPEEKIPLGRPRHSGRIILNGFSSGGMGRHGPV